MLPNLYSLKICSRVGIRIESLTGVIKDDSFKELDDIFAQTSFLAASCVQSASAFNVHKRVEGLKLEIC